MWQWVQDNHGVLSAVASLAMLAVWILYLQLFYLSYRHQLRPKILINRGAGRSLKSRCIVTNMSSETVYVEAILLELTVEGRQYLCSLSDIDRLASGRSEERPDPRGNWFQGPLGSGDYLDFGSFEDLFGIVLRNHQIDGPNRTVSKATITILGDYTWRDLIGAEREFQIDPTGGSPELRAERGTRQLTSLLDKRRLQHLLVQQDACGADPSSREPAVVRETARTADRASQLAPSSLPQSRE